eukprot:TRINITY_DN5721_c0_g1_i2.p1 TRINITY_DN5721_c0_g1~~TRINITY_DN5721_c0_g1_i2.p1  ORF type:complete len:391 (+),score=39.50 TRINITY_DN5721_c0_g1_i2:538-1710(+)
MWKHVRIAVRAVAMGRRCKSSAPTAERATIFSKSKIGQKTKKFVNCRIPLELGSELVDVDIVWEEWGNPKNPRVVLVLPSLSVGSHARSSVNDPLPGWWEDMIGPEKGIDTERFRVICPAGLGSPFGTTSPISQQSNSKIYGRHFPNITPLDQARCHKLLLDHLGLTRLHAVVGSSLGGCTALSLCSAYPDLAQKLVAISCTGKSSPGTVALRAVQRAAVMADEDFMQGDYHLHGKLPMRGMKVARQMGMITYRSRAEFNQRFDWDPQQQDTGEYRFDVENYLEHKSKEFAAAYDPNCFLLMSRCGDSMDLGRAFSSYAEGLISIQSEVCLIGVTNDMIIPLSEQQYMHNVLNAHKKNAQLHIVDSIYGHDAFMLDHAWFVPTIRKFLGP